MDSTYSLISEILSIAGRYDIATLRRAESHVRQNLRGVDGEVVLAIIVALQKLADRSVHSEYSSESRTADKVHMVSESAAESPQNDEVDGIAREVRAILMDRTFTATRADLVALIERIWGSKFVFGGEKDSRTALVSRILKSYRQLDKQRQKSIYQQLRRAYMQGRQSSLGGWTEIISPGERK
jgi:hypothetical protein